MKHSRFAAVAAVAVIVAAIGAATAAATGFFHQHRGSTEQAVRNALQDRTPKNVIFFLGDGMGTQEITAARYYQGVNNDLNVDRMPFTGFDTTWSVKPAASPPYLPDYDPDSASTGTAWATGRKTIDERISQGPSSAENVPGANLKTVLEIAQKKGMRVGDVSTAEITDATPAVLASHISLRGCQGPANMAPLPDRDEGRRRPWIDRRAGGRSQGRRAARWRPSAASNSRSAAARTQGKRLSSPRRARATSSSPTRPACSAVSSVAKKPVLGLFNKGNMSLEWSGPSATLGKGNTPSVPCNENQRPANEPSLSAMTDKAIDLLDNHRGFFLQVEGASIDKQDHATNACGQIGETVAFDDAIGVALDYQRHNPDTLIVVTADHAHTSQIVGEDAKESGLPTGYSANLLTKDGQTLAITYGTAGYGGPGAAPVAVPSSQQHTGAVVPVWGSGPGSLDILGTNDHTDLFDVLGG